MLSMTRGVNPSTTRSPRCNVPVPTSFNLPHLIVRDIGPRLIREPDPVERLFGLRIDAKHGGRCPIACHDLVANGDVFDLDPSRWRQDEAPVSKRLPLAPASKDEDQILLRVDETGLRRRRREVNRGHRPARRSSRAAPPRLFRLSRRLATR